MAIKWMNKKLRAAAHDYVEAFLEACTLKNVKDPLDALKNTDAYPRLQKIPEVEYSVGWINGVADTIGIEPAELFAHVTTELSAVTRAKIEVTRALDKSVDKIQRKLKPRGA